MMSSLSKKQIHHKNISVDIVDIVNPDAST